MNEEEIVESHKLVIVGSIVAVAAGVWGAKKIARKHKTTKKIQDQKIQNFQYALNALQHIRRIANSPAHTDEDLMKAIEDETLFLEFVATEAIW